LKRRKITDNKGLGGVRPDLARDRHEYYSKGGKNPGDFWSITTKPFPEGHFAVFPEALCEKPIKAGCPKWVCKKCGKPRERVIELGEIIDCGCNAGFRPGVVLDPFAGAGTTLLVARKHGRNSIGIELNPEYVKIAEKRLRRIPNMTLTEFDDARTK